YSGLVQAEGHGQPTDPASDDDHFHARAALVSLRGRPHVLHGLEVGKLYAIELAIHFFDFANVDIVDYVAGLRVDRHRAARAFPTHTPLIADISVLLSAEPLLFFNAS